MLASSEDLTIRKYMLLTFISMVLTRVLVYLDTSLVKIRLWHPRPSFSHFHIMDIWMCSLMNLSFEISHKINICRFPFVTESWYDCPLATNQKYWYFLQHGAHLEDDSTNMPIDDSVYWKTSWNKHLPIHILKWPWWHLPTHKRSTKHSEQRQTVQR